MEAYLFVHFKEKKTPDGEQVYFALSTDGFNWEAVNGEQPVLWSNLGEKGVRDHTIIRTHNGKFYILATDLSLANCFHTKYKGDWSNIGRDASKCLSLWESDDLVNWSDQRMIELGDTDFGCLWAPDVIYDYQNEDYVIHWSSSHASIIMGIRPSIIRVLRILTALANHGCCAGRMAAELSIRQFMKRTACITAS